MDINKTLSLCKELQSECHKLLANGANETINPGSEEKYREIMLRMRKIAEVIYPNSEDQVSDHNSLKTSASSRDDYTNTGNFENQVRATCRFLQSMIDQLSIRELEDEQSYKIDKIESQIIEKDKEVQRRGKVVDTKIHGASIEMIDRLRQEIKRSTDVKSDIIEIKNELKELRQLLSLLLKDSEEKIPE